MTIAKIHRLHLVQGKGIKTFYSVCRGRWFATCCAPARRSSAIGAHASR